MKVYTKGGDDGTTQLIGGERVDKTDLRVCAYGTVDELTANIAYLRDSMEGEIDLTNYRDDLYRVLFSLMRVSALLAASASSVAEMPQLHSEQIEYLEKRMDYMQSTLKPITHFTVPGGHPLVSLCHISRTVCRRCERETLKAAKEFTVNPLIIKYLNRLSDYLYVLGRKISDEFNIKEIYWEE